MYRCDVYVYRGRKPPLYVTWSYIKTPYIYVGHRSRVITMPLIGAKLIEASRSTYQPIYDTVVSGYVEKVEALPTGGSKPD